MIRDIGNIAMGESYQWDAVFPDGDITSRAAMVNVCTFHLRRTPSWSGSTPRTTTLFGSTHMLEKSSRRFSGKSNSGTAMTGIRISPCDGFPM